MNILLTSVIFMVACTSGEHNTLEGELTIYKEEDVKQDNSELQLEAPTDNLGGTETDKTLDEQYIIVYVCGAVNNPGVYELLEDERVEKAIKLAGGMTEEADLEYINLASHLEDGMQITVLTKEEVLTQETVINEVKDGIVNLNLATVDELDALNGIGESRAKDIIDYRERLGGFTSIEQIMEVSGIGPSLYEKIKDKIKI